MAPGYDVIVAGAGPAGVAAAIALGDGGASVALVHHPPRADRYRVGESATPSVVPLLERLGLATDLAALGHLPCHGNRAVWGGGAVVEQDYLVHGQGHGWHLDRAAFDGWLLAQAEARGVSLVHGAVADLGRLEPGGWGVRLDEKGAPPLFGRALVDATGRASLVARRLGARRRRIDTLTAVARLHPAAADHPLRHLSLIESHPLGWWYAAAIPGGRLVSAFMSDADLIREHGLDRPDRLDALHAESDELRRLLPGDEGEREVWVYPAHSGHLDRIAGPGWIAIGDAALGMDPLTSSGINSALADGLAAAGALRPWLATGDSDGLRDHAEKMNRTVVIYLDERTRFYGRERRWSDHPFWRRRAI
ncbi:NAD(P)/FAD-dependent oxidoreductase [Endothiovibrio diazotrophicus]